MKEPSKGIWRERSSDINWDSPWGRRSAPPSTWHSRLLLPHGLGNTTAGSEDLPRLPGGCSAGRLNRLLGWTSGCARLGKCQKSIAKRGRLNLGHHLCWPPVESPRRHSGERRWRSLAVEAWLQATTICPKDRNDQDRHPEQHTATPILGEAACHNVSNTAQRPSDSQKPLALSQYSEALCTATCNSSASRSSRNLPECRKTPSENSQTSRS
mmetsp:Transcript_64864/g.142220  ORF Transcript_64864/g.142220 Transcript_64864/m.142220 type:complete len:212 (+) Transcript_64864:127-762(+)